MSGGAERGRAHLRAVGAVPRPAGGAAEGAARAYAAAVLRAAGYDVAEVPFTYSDVPGRFGTPAAGVWSALTLGAAAAAGGSGRPAGALLALGTGAAVLAAVGAWVARAGTVRIGWRRRPGVNLVATRGVTPAAESLPGGGVGVWLVAHLDTKSQPVPMVLRVAGVAGAIGCAGLVGLLGMAELVTGRAIAGAVGWLVLGVLGVVVSVPVVATTVGAASDGALDNASGVAAVLVAAEWLAEGAARVGVLLTSAEELGLAGARAWAAAWAAAGRAPVTAFNCDGVDDAGGVTVLRGARLTGRAGRAVEAVGVGVRVRRIPPGLLVDAVALAAAGWEAVTVSRGTWGTLARVHTRRDTLGRLRGDGIEAAAEVLVRLVLGANPVR